MKGESYAQAKSRINFEKLSDDEREEKMRTQRVTDREISKNTYEIQKNYDETMVKALSRGAIRTTFRSGGGVYPASSIMYFAPTRGENENQANYRDKIPPKPGTGKWISMPEAQAESGIYPVLPEALAENNVIPIHPQETQAVENWDHTQQSGQDQEALA